MSRVQILLFSAVSLVIIAFTIILIKPDAPLLSATRTITLTQDGFSPSKLVITEGDTVTFASMLEKPFWPASDLHPTHSVYSEFDPRKPISATSTWSFTFNKAGTWGFHDHLASRKVGSVVVLTKGGKVVKEDCQKDEESEKCLEKEITGTLAKKGLDAAFERMSELYETSPLFRATCHTNAHILGEAAYDLFKKGKMSGLSPKTSYCGYGFYHGFMEKMLQTTGSLEEAQAFCKQAGILLAKETSDAEGACYHGIGHGSMDGSDPTLWGDAQTMITPSIKLCEKVAPLDEYQGKQYRCITGVYNAIEILSQNSEYGLDKLRDDPFGLCPSQPVKYQEGCYTNMLPALMRKVGGSYDRAIGEIMKIPKGTPDRPIRSHVLSSLMHDYIREYINSDNLFEIAVKACRKVSEDVRISCFEGLSGGFMKYGEPQKEYIKALDFCASPLLKSDESDACYRYIIPRFRIWYTVEKISQICASVPEQHKSYCGKSGI